MNHFPKLEDYLNSMQWEDADKKWLVGYWADSAANDPVDAKSYFRGLIDNADLTAAFRRQVAGVWQGDSGRDALRLFGWAWNRGVNPKDPRFTTLASIILPSLQEAGPDKALGLAALVAKYKLIASKTIAQEFAWRYQVPSSAPPIGDGESLGPDFAWTGPEDALQLQGLFGDEPAEYFVKFLMLAVVAASAVCRVEIAPEAGHAPAIRGTGVLIAPRLVLTNYHVLGETDDDVSAAAKRTQLRFGALTDSNVRGEEGQVVPVVTALEMSPPAKDDFVLLEAHSSISDRMGLVPAVLSSEPPPSERDGFHILHHPGGTAMRVCISKNGVAKVLQDHGKIQYFSKTSLGSSGAPCFNDKFEVVALHHAVRSRFGGVIGQGILIGAIRDRLEQHV